jgi:hypothetical protein
METMNDAKWRDSIILAAMIVLGSYAVASIADLFLGPPPGTQVAHAVIPAALIMVVIICLSVVLWRASLPDPEPSAAGP